MVISSVPICPVVFCGDFRLARQLSMNRNAHAVTLRVRQYVFQSNNASHSSGIILGRGESPEKVCIHRLYFYCGSA